MLRGPLINSFFFLVLVIGVSITVVLLAPFFEHRMAVMGMSWLRPWLVVLFLLALASTILVFVLWRRGRP